MLGAAGGESESDNFFNGFSVNALSETQLSPIDLNYVVTRSRWISRVYSGRNPGVVNSTKRRHATRSWLPNMLPEIQVGYESDLNNMSYDTDNMSYEQRLELGERNGDVNIGLSEETISTNLGTRLHTESPKSEAINEDSEICSICQAEEPGDCWNS